MIICYGIVLLMMLLIIWFYFWDKYKCPDCNMPFELKYHKLYSSIGGHNFVTNVRKCSYCSFEQTKPGTEDLWPELSQNEFEKSV